MDGPVVYPMPRLTLALVLSLVPALVSCADRTDQAAPGTSAFSVRDSAGIAIARSTGPTWPDDYGWTASEAPLVSIGASPDGRETLFEVGSIVPLADGGFALAHGSRREIVWFDSTGQRLFAAGGEGDGPGEFRGSSRLFLLPGDSILATDIRLARLSVFDASGRFVRSSRLEVEAGGGSPTVLLPGRRLLARPGFSFNTSTPDGIARDTAVLPQFDLSGAHTGDVGPFPLGEYHVFKIGESTAAGPHPLGKRVLLAPAAQGFWLTTGDRPEVELRGADGTLRRIARWADESPSLTDEFISRFEADVRATSETPEDRQMVETFLEDMTYPATLPSALGLMTDSEGNLWVQPFVTFPEKSSPPWMVLDPDGRWLGEVSLPDRFEPRAITTDRLYGVWTDELDVESVRVYGLERQEPK